MSRGKYLSLEEARQTGQIERFCKEHPSKADRKRFEALLDAMTKGSATADQTSAPASSEGYTETRTRRGTSEDASD